MSFSDYQQWTRTTAIYDNKLYPVLGLTEEAGEVAGKVAKSLRDKTLIDRDSIVKELGDVLWMLARIADDMGISLQEVADMNKAKLMSRQSRNAISGAGDNR